MSTHRENWWMNYERGDYEHNVPLLHDEASLHELGPEAEAEFAAFRAWLHSENRPKQMEGPSWNRTEVRHGLFINAKAYRDLHKHGPQPDLTKKPTFWIPFPGPDGRPEPTPDNIVPTAWSVFGYRCRHLSAAESAVATPKDIRRAYFNNELFLWRRVWHYRAKGDTARASRAEAYCAKLPEDEDDEEYYDDSEEEQTELSGSGPPVPAPHAEEQADPSGSRFTVLPPPYAAPSADHRRHGEDTPPPPLSAPHQAGEPSGPPAIDNGRYQAYRPPAGPAPPLPPRPRPTPPPQEAMVDENGFRPYRPGANTSLAAKDSPHNGNHLSRQVAGGGATVAGRAEQAQQRIEASASSAIQPKGRISDDRYHNEYRNRLG